MPVIVFEDLDIGNSIQRSAELFRKNWGEQISGSFGFSLLTFLLFLPGLAIGALVYPYDRPAGVILAVVYLLILAVLSSAARGVFTVALYRYATDHVAPWGFSANSLDPVWRSRPRGAYPENKLRGI